ncbi:MAG TPA: glycosyltransferase [Myxococcaceae bacterium]|jgi:glycosyltransferase involved in cell wall biosynthesis
MKVALVHDWLVAFRGGERVLDAMARIFPDADLYTLLRKPGALPPSLESRHLRTSRLQALPGVHRYYKHLLPLLPAAIRSMTLERGYDLVISSSHCVAKGIRVPPGARHLSYVHAPMRYMWHHFADYFGPGRAGLVTRLGARAARPFLRRWDVRSSRGVDRFVANSRHIAGRIRELYGREAGVVYPPVDLDRFIREPPGDGRGGYLLWLGATVPYKRVDLAIAAAAQSGAPLWIAGQGQESLREVPSNVKLLGTVKEEDVPALYRNARALLFTGEEDFGLTPLEAQACGRPVVALSRGGALETVTPRTGVFFHEPTPGALLAALRELDGFERRFDPAEARANALRFGPEQFREGLLREVNALMGDIRQPGPES